MINEKINKKKQILDLITNYLIIDKKSLIFY